MLTNIPPPLKLFISEVNVIIQSFISVKKSVFNMLFITQNSSMFHLLLMVTLCLHKCVGNIEENKYAFMKMISMNEEQNVYCKFLIPYKRNYILTCGAKCGIDESCMGIDVCDGRICRLWNATFYPSLLSNDSNGLCKRYIKVIFVCTFYFCYKKTLKVIREFVELYIRDKSNFCNLLILK